MPDICVGEVVSGSSLDVKNGTNCCFNMQWSNIQEGKPWLVIYTTNAQLGLTDKGCAIKGFVIFACWT